MAISILNSDGGAGEAYAEMFSLRGPGECFDAVDGLLVGVLLGVGEFSGFVIDVLRFGSKGQFYFLCYKSKKNL